MFCAFMKFQCNAGTSQGVRRADLVLFAVLEFEPGDPEYRKAGADGRSDGPGWFIVPAGS
jgi:hypothetical protein